ncbi:hypothetical protein ACFQO4_20695 [Saliphagus sp. GCM10025334]
MSTHRIGPVSVEIDTRDLSKVLTGARTALFRSSPPFDPDRLPEGWRLQRRNGKTRPWPTGWTRPTDYWLSIWKAGSEHITIMPYKGAWRVEYDPENTWMSGSTLGRGFSFDEAVDVAIDAASRVNDGATERELRLDYRDWGESNEVGER